MTGFTYMGKNLQKCPLNRGFPFETPLRFFQKSGSVTFVPSWCPLRYLKTGGRTDGRTDRRRKAITRDSLGRTQGPKDIKHYTN